MTNSTDSNAQREFRCEHCDGLIRVPIDLPPTTAPCPHCSEDITSPGDKKPDLPEETPTTSKVEFPTATEVPESGQGIEAPSDVEDGEEASMPADEIDSDSPARKTPFLPAAIAMICLVLVVSAVIAFLLVNRNGNDQSENSGMAERERENNYIRTGWKAEAYKVLEKFIAGRTVEEKLPYVLNAEDVEEKMRAFYGDDPIHDFDTPAEAFSIYDLPENDRRNGMYMLVFDQPPQLDMRNFFRPVASLEVQYGLEKADILLNSMAQFTNFSMEPVRAHALFKMTDQGLKLDWEVFAQTKYRKLREFIDSKKVGRTEVFRVFITEDVPKRGNISSDSRTYRISDPANMDDSARVKVLTDTKIASELAVLNWVGVQGAREYSRTATIELEWRPGEYEPYLSIKRFICWEYLGLGGKEISSTESDGEESPEEEASEDP